MMNIKKVDSDTRKPEVGSELKAFYRPELDILRLVAFLFVFLAHTLPSPEGLSPALRLLRAIRYTGTLGVPVFFLLSAYLITELLLRERTVTGDVDILAFYARRILRIWPLYFLMLCGTAIAGLFDTTYAVSRNALASYLLLSGNWYTIITGTWLPLSALPLWSIGIEEQFYLLWPTVVRRVDKHAIFCLSAVLWLLSQAAVWQMCLRRLPISPDVWINSFTHLQFFALGALMSVFLEGRTMRWGLLARGLVAFAGIAMLFISEFFFNVFSRTAIAVAHLTIPGYMLVGLATVLLFLSVLGLRVAAWASPMVKLGKISYGLYVFHGICVHLSIVVAARLFHVEHFRVVIAYIVGLPLSIAVAALSYSYLETPFLRLKERFTVVKSRAI